MTDTARLNALNALLNEREILRPTVLAMQTSTHQALFAIITVVTLIGAAYLSEGLLSVDVRINALLLLSQVEFFLGFFVVGLVAHQNVPAGYIGAIEVRINELLGKRLTAFESEVAPRFYKSRRGAFGLWKIIMFSMLISSFVAIAYFTAAPGAWRWIFIAEGSVLSLLLWRARGDVSRVRMYALSILSPCANVMAATVPPPPA